MDQHVDTDQAGRVTRNRAQEPTHDAQDGPRAAHPEVPMSEAPAAVYITHPDGRTATVSPKVAAFLAHEGFTVSPYAEPKAAPKAPATAPKAKAAPDQGE
jgi:hypothetical protein